MTMAERLRTLREHATLSQAEVAAALDVSIPTISEWEKGKKKPSRERIPGLARLYKVSSDYILLGKDIDLNTPEVDDINELVRLFRSADQKIKDAVITILKSSSS
ncbi:helix-turn-helix transcriptional regulator [Acetobacter sacchari]|uniref:Helix-turn-helix transcriptional regulator n=1 Tax=Acetobacter sacchari TaxID=2661687 RepID=A0ABS3M013_9PROT|nr:helix-turn-helix transcriptional regulator [Acetobacter sacchari]MBO1361510.1 helix-turn-helix transcriptional regulator [Acetobacter sacchari]